MARYEKLIANPTAREEELLALWRKNGTFRRSLAATKDGPRYVFYEGPPTANGRPHFGHLMPRVYKDLFPRYKTMQGFHVGRKGGWDTHGLPVELEVEHEIGVNSKPEIEAYGVERFVKRCKQSVWKYKAEWERMIERMGFWIDLEDAYITYTDEYIETVWWELAQMYERGLLYRGHKVLPYCSRCGTGLSSHEVAQGYRAVEEPAISVRMPVVSDAASTFKLQAPGRTSLLTWTTTPWTLPANVALAVAGEATYAEVALGDERLILAEALVKSVLGEDASVVRRARGADLVGLSYDPPYRLVSDESAYRVHTADFVNLEEGTGIVHTAPAFGEDDYRLGQQAGLPFFHPVGLDGRFTEAFPLAAGTFVKDADPKIIEDLETRGLLFRAAPYEHEYPFCWRCDTPLLYYAMDSWFIRTTAVKDELIANNAGIHWHPAHVGEGRLGDFLENLKDWALSRDRYWGTPLNLWICEACGETHAVGSRARLAELALDPDLASSVELHRPYIDRVELACPSCGGTMRRVPHVIDAWFDSGSMHTAQWHYPFEHVEEFKRNYPADFICEATDQTRGWFYTLLATGTILHGQAPYRNCMVTGLGLDSDGLKMSKSKGNVIDPWELIDAYGADTLRWYFYSSSAPWKSKRLGKDAVKEPLYRFLDTLRNTYDFFALYASIDDFDPQTHRARDGDLSLLDQWLLSRLATTVAGVVTRLEAYDVVGATAVIEGFVDDLSNWYIRSSRRRFWKGGMEGDKVAAYATLYQVLVEVSKLVAPFIPFLAEAIYQSLRTPGDRDSVHLCAFPSPDEARRNARLEEEMTVARAIVSLGHQARHQAQIKVRQPLARALLAAGDGHDAAALSDDVLALVRSELNLDRLEFVPTFDSYLARVAVPNFRSLGPRLGGQAAAAAEWIKAQPAEEVRAALDSRAPVTIDGNEVALQPEDVVFEAVLPDGWVLAEESGLRLLLDTHIDEALREKGLLREVIHRIQTLRKEAGFEVTDRIRLCYETPDASLAVLLERNTALVQSETLAEAVVASLGTDSEYEQALDIEGIPMRIGLSRV